AAEDREGSCEHDDETEKPQPPNRVHVDLRATLGSLPGRKGSLARGCGDPRDDIHTDCELRSAYRSRRDGCKPPQTRNVPYRKNDGRPEGRPFLAGVSGAPGCTV